MSSNDQLPFWKQSEKPFIGGTGCFLITMLSMIPLSIGFMIATNAIVDSNSTLSESAMRDVARKRTLMLVNSDHKEFESIFQDYLKVEKIKKEIRSLHEDSSVCTERCKVKGRQIVLLEAQAKDKAKKDLGVGIGWGQSR